jgi:hypothetical protein
MERELSAGAYLLAVDTWSTEQGESWPGGFVLSIEAFANGVWYEVALGEGLSWRHQRRRGGPLDDQSLDVLEVDPTRWELAPIRHDGCERVPDVALDLGALGAINAAFFEFDGVCTAKDMIRRDGVTEATNQKDDPQRTMVWNDGEAPSFAWVDLGADHTEHDNAVGGWPSLVTDSAVLAEPARTDSFHTARHPRSALAVTADGTLLLATADGRTAHGDGMTIEEWAGTLRDLGAVHAINVDGGGSSTLVAAGCSLEGTVNHPSDGGGDDHSGARWVSDGVYVLER